MTDKTNIKQLRKLEALAKRNEQNQKFNKSNLMVNSFDANNSSQLFGYLNLDCSMVYTNLTDLIINSDVWIRARLQYVKSIGKNAFLILRQQTHTIQAIVSKSDLITKDFIKFTEQIPYESIIVLKGLIKSCDDIKQCSISNKEIHISRLYILSESISSLPIQLNEMSNTGLELRLDNRVLDLRNPINLAIYKIQSKMSEYFRNYLIQNNFVEIHTPKLLGASSEGGSNVFEVKYFDGKAYLAQSPQLYKQMSVQGDLMKVFEIGPVFRAENSNTHRHLTEFVGLDIEMVINYSYNEILDQMEQLLVYIFSNIKKNCSNELEIIKKEYPVDELKYLPYLNLRLKYKDAIQMLRDDGLENIEDTYDMTTTDEKRLGRIIREKYQTDFYMIEKFPSSLRPFYTMKDPNDSTWSNSFDIFVRGEEICSGSQRIHDPDILIECAKNKGVDIKTIQSYIDCFKYGAYPHGGAGIGLERLVMLFLGLGNIRLSSLYPRDPKRLVP